MKKVIDIAIKDMTQFFRSLIALVMMFAVPILLTGMFYIMFGGIGAEDDFEIPVTKVIVVNQDTGEVQLDPSTIGSLPTENSQEATSSEITSMGDMVTAMLVSEKFENLMNVTVMDDAKQAKGAIDNQEAGVAILIPENFSDAMTQPESQAVVGLYYDPTLTLGPKIVKGILQQILDSYSSSKITLQITFEQMATTGVPMDENVSTAIVGAYFNEMLGRSQDQELPALVEYLDTSGEEISSPASIGIISMMMTGMTVFYVFFTGASTAQSLLTEDKKGTLPRLFTTPTLRSTILAGKFLSGVLMIIVQITVLLLFGYLVFQIEWGLLTTLLPIIITLTLTASTFGIFLMSWVYTERQAGLMIGGFLTIMGMLGMMPIFTFGLQNPPQIVSILSHLVPHGWAIEGLAIAMEGGLPADVALNSVVLLGWSILFFVIGVRRFRNRFA